METKTNKDMAKYKVTALMADGTKKKGYVLATNGESAEAEAEAKFPGMKYCEIELA